MKESYFGSVRFYKNLILIVIVAAISLGFGLAIHYRHQWSKTEEALSSLQDSSPYSPQDNSQMVSLSSDDELFYQSLYPDFYAPQPPVTVPAEKQMVYLTFDDSPSALTADLLSALRESHVHATFFITGVYQEDDAIDLLNAIAADGHTLGMLSWSNDYSTIYRSVEDYLADMYLLFSYIKEATGITPTVFRFPGGSVNSYNAGIYSELVAEMLRRGFVPFDWNVSSQDTIATEPAEIFSRVVSLSETMSRNIVLMHNTENTVAVLGDIVDKLSSSGYSFAPLDEHVKPILFSYR